jgi:hypothetical protein
LGDFLSRSNNLLAGLHGDTIDTDFGQDKGDASALKTVENEWRSEPNKKESHEKKAEPHNNKAKVLKEELYQSFLILENDGIKLPD